MGVDILSREAQWQEATGDKLAVTPSVEAELVLVAVVGVAVQLYDHPSLDHQVHLADALNLHSVLEAQSCSMQIHSRQRLQRGTGPVTGAIESCERPSRARATKQIANLLGSDALVVKCRIESDEWGVVLEVTAQKTRHSLRKWLHREASRGCWTLVPIHVENLTSHGCESSAIRNHEVNLLGPLGHRQTVVVHGGLTSEEPAVNAGKDNGAFGARDTDNTMLVGDELTGSHERSDMPALGASQLQIPNAHCSVAATNNGEQVSIHGAHDAHCHPPAEWAQHGAGVLWTTVAAIRLWPRTARASRERRGRITPSRDHSSGVSRASRPVRAPRGALTGITVTTLARLGDRLPALRVDAPTCSMAKFLLSGWPDMS